MGGAASALSILNAQLPEEARYYRPGPAYILKAQEMQNLAAMALQCPHDPSNRPPRRQEHSFPAILDRVGNLYLGQIVEGGLPPVLVAVCRGGIPALRGDMLACPGRIVPGLHLNPRRKSRAAGAAPAPTNLDAARGKPPRLIRLPTIDAGFLL